MFPLCWREANLYLSLVLDTFLALVDSAISHVSLAHSQSTSVGYVISSRESSKKGIEVGGDDTVLRCLFGSVTTRTDTESQISKMLRYNTMCAKTTVRYGLTESGCMWNLFSVFGSTIGRLKEAEFGVWYFDWVVDWFLFGSSFSILDARIVDIDSKVGNCNNLCNFRCIVIITLNNS